MVDKNNDGKPKGLPPLAENELKLRIQLADIEEDLMRVRLTLDYETNESKIEKLED